MLSTEKNSTKMSNHLLSPFPVLLIFLFSPTNLAQSPAQAPAAPVAPSVPVAPAVPVTPAVPASPIVPVAPTPSGGPPNITAILEKAGHFITFIRLLKSTQTDTLIRNQLKDSSNGITVFAASDYAFGNLSTGALNSYSDQQKAQLSKFHLISSVLSISDFQTVTNPIATEAGTNIPMNVTETGNQLNITTGIVNTTVTGTIYIDNQLAVYQVDRVLLPLYFFSTPAPAPAPEPSKPKKKAPAPTGLLGDASVSLSGAVRLIQCGLGVVSFGGFLIAGLVLCV
ncbi:fasciclin-like arabinogalactan protein 12 [Actinidia eriantha]|uniref:fasciclin-like arabinogalactan protein 12 n=1 Tax=Actinidia eriantha TaxID=165200 RepID=UPI0025909C58|nr:fasciclin-like arabinogalactan protein 12 [Actinidia eriantha]